MGLAGWIIAMALQAGALPSLPAPPSLPCWIEGRWVSEEAEGKWTEENWTGCRAQTMLGTGRGGRADAVTSYEFMRIARNENGDLMFYGSPFGNPAAAFRAVRAGPAEASKSPMSSAGHSPPASAGRRARRSPRISG